MHELDIVIPVYNEGSYILGVLESLRAAVHVRFRVLVCYDHDADDTLEMLRRHPDHACEVVLVKNSSRGAHAAIVTGFRVSTAPAVLVFPADDTYNAPIIDAMLEKFGQGCAIVAASRFMKGGGMEGCPWLKAALVRSAAFTLKHLARIPTHDASNGFRLFSREVIEQIEIESSTGFTYSIELLAKCHRLGWKVCEVPALWFERTRGQSRFRVVKWLPAYLRWYFYAFATTYLRRGAATVPRRAKVAATPIA